MKAMPNIIAFKPKHQLENEKNLQDFINRAKNDLTIYEEQGGFDVNNVSPRPSHLFHRKLKRDNVHDFQ